VRNWLIAILALAAATCGGTALAQQVPNCGTITTCPVATAPLNGTEVTLGVQNGQTVQLPIALIDASAVSVSYTATAVPTVSIGANKAVALAGYRTPGDNGAGEIIASGSFCTASSLNVLSQDAGGVWFCVIPQNGVMNIGWFGAYGDAMFSFFNGTITTGPCVLNVTNIAGNGVIRAGDNVIGDGVTSSPTILAFGTSGTTGTGGNGTYALSACGADPAPSFTGSISGTALSASGLTGTLAKNQFINCTGGTGTFLANTQIASVVTAGSAYTVTQSQTYSGGTCTATLNIQTYGGHDDSAAVIAAATTGNDVLIQGPLSPSNATGPQIPYVGMLQGVTLPAKRQKLIMRSARFLALPGFVGDYMVTSGASRQYFDRLSIDGGGIIGTQWVGGFQCASNVTDGILEAPEIIHLGTAIGIDLEQSCRVYGASVQQWNNGEPQLSVQSNLTSIGVDFGHADSQYLGGYSNWNHTQFYFDCGAQTELIDQTHPYTGNSGVGAFVDPENTHVAGCSSGALTFLHQYDDNGQTNAFVPLSLRDLWPLQEQSNSTYTNGCFINFYPNGSAGQPTAADLRIYTQTGFLDPNSFFCLPDNPVTMTVTGGTATGSAITLTLGPSPTTQVTGVLATGTTVRYRVNWWNCLNSTMGNCHPLVGDTIAVAGFGNSAYNGTFTVTAVNPFYATVANTATGSPGTLGTVQPTSPWTADNPKPATGSTHGFITVAGITTSTDWNCTKCAVTGVTANSITYASAATDSYGAGGTVNEAWSFDWSALPGMETEFVGQAIETGSRTIVQQTTSANVFSFLGPAGPCGGLGFSYQINGNANVFTSCYTGNLLQMGTASGATTYQLGQEANPGGLYEDGSGHIYLREAGQNVWEAAPGFIPTTDGLSATGRTVGIPSLRPYFIYTHFLNISPSTVLALATNDPTPSDGDRAYVTDATACTFQSAVTGSGSVHCPVYYDGSSSSWKAG